MHRAQRVAELRQRFRHRDAVYFGRERKPGVLLRFPGRRVELDQHCRERAQSVALRGSGGELRQRWRGELMLLDRAAAVERLRQEVAEEGV